MSLPQIQKTENSNESKITIFAQTNFRNQSVTFGIKRADRRAHLYILGKTGTGKSTLLESLMLDDMRKGFGESESGQFSTRHTKADRDR